MAIREQILKDFRESLSTAGVMDRTDEQIAYNVNWSVDSARRTVAQGIQEARDRLNSVMAAA